MMSAEDTLPDRGLSFSDQQHTLYEWLLKKDSRLATIYLGALAVLSDSANPDSLALAAHNLRELMEKLPKVLDVPIEAHREAMKPKVLELQGDWDETVRQSLCHQDGIWAGEIDDHLRELLTRLEAFFEWVREHYPRMREETSAVLQRLDASGQPLPPSLDELNISVWEGMRDFFVAVAHHGKQHTRKEFLRQVSTLEAFLLDRIYPRTFDDIAEIDGILKASDVDPQTVQRAIELMRKRNINYWYFMGHLADPRWIKPLHKAGFFKLPPAPEIEGNSIRFPQWADSEYLVRMAKLPGCQAEVLTVALEIPGTNNVRVHEDLADIATNLPPEMAARFVKKARKWLQSSYHLRLPEKLGALMVHLAQGGEKRKALELARALLAIVGDDEKPGDGEESGELTRIFVGPEPRPRFDLWEYEEILRKYVPDLIEATGQDGLVLLGDLLDCTIGLSNLPHEIKGPDDYSHIWQPAIEDHEENMPRNLKCALVAAVRGAAEQLARRDPKCIPTLVGMLESRRWHVFHRIALHLLRLFKHGAFPLVVERLTDRDRFGNSVLLHEYLLLLSDCFGQLEDQHKETILSWIDEGPDLGPYRKGYRSSLGRPPSNAEVQRYAKIWQRDRLAPLSGSLPADWEVRYSDLVAEFGPPEPPDHSAVWVGPTSPKSSDELSAMTIADLVQYLRAWEPPRDHFAPSPEGLGRILSDVVAVDPQRFAEEAQEFRGLDPTYVRSLLHGLEQAARAKKTFQWDRILDLCEWVMTQPREIPERTSRYADLDPGWVWTRKEIANLLWAGFTQGPAEIPLEYRNRVWAILEPITSDPDPALGDEIHDGESGMDPVTRSIHTTRGVAMHAVVHYALWVRRHMEATPDGHIRVSLGFAALPEVREVLENHLDPRMDPTMTIRAVYGQYLPWLILLDPEWASAHLNLIFSDQADEAHLRDAAWDAYILRCKPYDSVFQVLWPEYARAVSRIGFGGTGRRDYADPDERLADHLMALYWRGRLDSQETVDILIEFYQKANDTLRGHAMEFVGRSLSDIPSEIPVSRIILQRLKDLWAKRFNVALEAESSQAFTEELGNFGWWFISGKFDDAWSIEQLGNVLKLVKKVEPADRVIERLAEMAAKMPLDAVRCLRGIAENDTRGWDVYISRESVRTILEYVLRSGDINTCDEAIAIIHLLGARGFLEFGDLVKSRAQQNKNDKLKA